MPHPGRVLCVSLITAWLAFSPQPALSAPRHIAITNDDGWDSPGIVALHRAFTSAGHTVTRVGPLTQQSGSSAAINASKLRVKRESERTYSASLDEKEGSEPLTAGLLAIEIATSLDGSPPDWLVSGINQGANLGNATQHSGTVGAVIGALGGSFTNPVSAIAVSTDEPQCDPACVERHYASVASFVVKLLDSLQQPLPAGVGLNVNYPALPTSEIRGVRVVRQGTGFPIAGRLLRLRFVCPRCAELQDGEYADVSLSPAPDPSNPGADTDSAAFAAGYITIVPIEGDHTANHWKSLRKDLKHLGRLTP
jgi:5'-nucleotidase